MLRLLLALTLALAGCGAQVTTVHYALEPGPNRCQVTEVRPTVMSTLATSVCWDKDARPIGLAGGAGEPMIGVPLSVLGAAAAVAGPVAGAVILGRGIERGVSKIGSPSSTVTVVAPGAP